MPRSRSTPRRAQAPDDAELANNLGVALGRTGRIAEGVRAVRTALALRPDYAEARRTLAALQASAMRDNKEGP